MTRSSTSARNKRGQPRTIPPSRSIALPILAAGVKREPTRSSGKLPHCFSLPSQLGTNERRCSSSFLRPLQSSRLQHLRNESSRAGPAHHQHQRPSLRATLPAQRRNDNYKRLSRWLTCIPTPPGEKGRRNLCHDHKLCNRRVWTESDDGEIIVPPTGANHQVE